MLFIVLSNDNMLTVYSVLLCSICSILMYVSWFFFFQAEDGIRDLVRSRGLGDVYKRQGTKIESGHIESIAPVDVVESRDSIEGNTNELLVGLSLIHI